MHTPYRLQRREFVTSSALAMACLPTVSRSCDGSLAANYDDLDSDAYLGPVELLAEVVDEQVFTEGPAWRADGSLYFTNVPAETILRYEVQTKRLTVVRRNTGRANGLFFDRDGQLLACEGGRGRVTRTNLKTGEQSVLADQFEGKPLAAPNDLCQDKMGRIYFTSRTAPQDPVGENPKAVYRIDPDGSLYRLLSWPDTHMPNGIALSPDQRTLYLIEAHPDAGHHRQLRAFDLDGAGRISGMRVFVDFSPGRSGDGMCVDRHGRLYVAAGLHKRRGTSESLDTRPGIHVFSPDGQLLAFRQTPEDTVTNCTLGGSNGEMLMVTCGRLLLGIKAKRAS